MFQRKSQLLCMWFFLCDLAMTALGWVGAYALRVESGWLPLNKVPPTWEECLAHLPGVMILAALAYYLTGLYTIHRLRRFREEVHSVCKGVLLLTLLIIAALFGTQDRYESRMTMILVPLLTGLLLLVSRRCSWSILRRLRSRGFNQSYAIIVGTGRVARSLARSLRRTSWLGIKPIGFVEENPSHWTNDLDILGVTADLPALVQKYDVEQVFVALPLNRYHEARKVFDSLSQTTVDVRMVADLPALAGMALTTSNLDGLPVIGLRESPHFGLNVVVKRGMDIVLALLALLFLSPLLLLIAILVKLTSPGPVFYTQERCGLNGGSFKMLKFRSMSVNAEAKSGAVWAQKNDPRCTPLGAFLRKTSMDELPQFLNVLLGAMSIVGPRPERPELIQKFRKTIPNYMARHAVKAGITGWAQVNGWRGNTSLRKRVQCDLYYITHWTPWLDLRILWLTVFRGLVHRNAY